jgi:hypothetical protein
MQTCAAWIVSSYSEASRDITARFYGIRKKTLTAELIDVGQISKDLLDGEFSSILAVFTL